ncbi:MAG TPA: hypothetical protein VJS13_13330 [Pyrinomonadaceae bacterium]|nr:hypothetical protein [Pyrinomonadaceae bacterium]
MAKQDVPKPIVIDNIDDKTKHIGEIGITARMLAGCYFYPMADGKYNLYSKADVLLKHGIKPDEKEFVFDFGPFTWGVKDFSISLEQASGHWDAWVPRMLPINPPGLGNGDDEGTFQAQAGGHGVAEEKATAASSY